MERIHGAVHSRVLSYRTRTVESHEKADRHGNGQKINAFSYASTTSTRQPSIISAHSRR